MVDTEFVCNIRPSPVDERDYKYIGTNVKLPDSIDYRDSLNDIRNQEKQGSCFAHAAAGAKECRRTKQWFY